MSFSTILIVVLCIVIMAVKAGKAVKKSFPVPPATDTADCFDDENGCSEENYETQDQEYFSYENTPDDSCFVENMPTNVARETDSANAIVDRDAPSPLADFDLRQAVVYNAILHNDYIESRP